MITRQSLSFTSRFARCYSSHGHLTKDRYPHIKRHQFAEVTDSIVQQFERILGKSGVLTSDLNSYNEDWLKMVCGYSKVVLRPKTVQEVSDVVKICHKENLAICPQGGNTGLVGGSVPVFDEVIISLGLMNQIIEIDQLSGTVTCEAGCVLETLDSKVGEQGMMMPLDLGAKGSCQIGGNISTNAGGLRLLRYGSLLGNTLGLQVVKADGEIIDCLNVLKKDNTGYHLREMFIGAEGTLGIVTAATIQCPVRPNFTNLAFIGLSDFNGVLKTLVEAKSSLNEVLSSCEMMDSVCMDNILDLGLKNPLEAECPFYMVIETQSSEPSSQLEAFLEKIMDSGEQIVTATLADSPSQIHKLWQIRERITEALLKGGYVYKYDISLPQAAFYNIVGAMKDRLDGVSGIKSVSGFGHIGDGNIHLNIQADSFDRSVLQKIEPFIFEWTKAHKGSISAEHGIGFKKAEYLHFGKSDAAIKMMRGIKKFMDPKGIMNPYKVLPPEN